MPNQVSPRLVPSYIYEHAEKRNPANRHSRWGCVPQAYLPEKAPRAVPALESQRCFVQPADACQVPNELETDRANDRPV